MSYSLLRWDLNFLNTSAVQGQPLTGTGTQGSAAALLYPELDVTQKCRAAEAPKSAALCPLL